MVQGLCGGLCIWLLHGWWKEDSRIPQMAKLVAIAVGVLAIGGMAVSSAYSRGISQQWSADLDSSSSNSEETSELIGKLRASLFDHPLTEDQRAIFDKLFTQHYHPIMVDKSIMSDHSVWLVIALWVVSNVVGFVPAPRSEKREVADRQIDGSPHDDDST